MRVTVRGVESFVKAADVQRFPDFLRCGRQG
jgi:hypothetical protein